MWRGALAARNGLRGASCAISHHFGRLRASSVPFHTSSLPAVRDLRLLIQHGQCEPARGLWPLGGLQSPCGATDCMQETGVSARPTS